MITLEMVRSEINRILAENKEIKEQADEKNYLKEEIISGRIDNLTSLPNGNFLKRIFYLLNLYIIEGILSKENAFAIGYCDINGLKMLNDTNGHQIGDIGMVEIVNIIKQNLRHNRDFLGDDKLFFFEKMADDVAIRYGGDEFLLVLPSCNKFEADDLVSERIKKGIKQNLDKTQQLSLAIGFISTDEEWVVLPPNLEEDSIKIFFQQLVTEAENRMYEDKAKMGQEDRYDRAASHIMRMFDVMGLDLKNPDHIKIVTDLIKETHESSLDIDIKKKV